MKRFAILFIGLMVMSSLKGETGAPRDTVEYFQSRLLESTRQESYSQRYDYLEPVVAETFSTQTIARIALGRNWRSLSEDQRDRLEGLMADLVISSYASQFASSGHKFHINATSSLAADRAIVKTTLITAQGQMADLDYQLVHANDKWKIYDVVANGVSDLSMKRSVYAAKFSEEGFDGVVESIRSNIEENEP